MAVSNESPFSPVQTDEDFTLDIAIVNFKFLECRLKAKHREPVYSQCWCIIFTLYLCDTVADWPEQ